MYSDTNSEPRNIDPHTSRRARDSGTPAPSSTQQRRVGCPHFQSADCASSGLRQTLVRPRTVRGGKGLQRVESWWHHRFPQCSRRVPSGQLPITNVPVGSSLFRPYKLLIYVLPFPRPLLAAWMWFALPLSPNPEFNSFSHISQVCRN